MFVWSLVVSMSVSGFHLCQKKPTGQHPETEPATRPQPGPPESSEWFLCPSTGQTGTSKYLGLSETWNRCTVACTSLWSSCKSSYMATLEVVCCGTELSSHFIYLVFRDSQSTLLGPSVCRNILYFVSVKVCVWYHAWYYLLAAKRWQIWAPALANVFIQRCEVGF